MRAIETPLSSTMGTMWCLYDLTPSQLVQKRCSFHILQSEDPNQHLKDFIKLMDSVDLDVANKERMRLRLFNFPFAIKLANSLNVFQQDPSPFERILLLNRIRTPPPPKRVHFINTITIIRKEDEPNEENIVEPNAIKYDNHNIIVKIDKKVGDELSGSKTIIGECESRNIIQDDPDNRVRGDTKGVDEVDEKSVKSEEEEEEEDDQEYFDAFPTVEELGYHEWLLINLRPPWVYA
nr:MAK10-like protein [Tanacetum cinerariifolium]